MSAETLRVLHVSPQPEDIARKYESEGFDVAPQLLKHFRLAHEDLIVETVYADRGVPEPREMKDFDALVVTGSVHSVYDPPPFQGSLENLIRETVRDDIIPFLGNCYGHQSAGHAFGGTVERSAWEEVGTFRMELTERGLVDPLFTGVDKHFHALSIHGDVVTTAVKYLQIEAYETVRSTLYGNHGFVLGKRGRTLQSHPEITPRLFNALMKVETHDTIPPIVGAQQLRNVYQSSSRILQNFIRYFVLDKGRA